MGAVLVGKAALLLCWLLILVVVVVAVVVVVPQTTFLCSLLIAFEPRQSLNCVIRLVYRYIVRD